ncbi:MAG TPA: LysR family transcriptional regulator [Gemmatimonadaceae bacterium]
MDLRQLRALVAVSEEKTFIAAAKRLNLAQPALSRQIRTFEKEIGTAVFLRGRAGVTLTAAGEICLKTARSIIQKVDVALEGAKLASAGKVGTCTIYVSQWCVWTGFTGKLLAHLAKHDPGIDVVIREGEIGTQWECLRRNHVDLSITNMPPSGYEDLHSETLLDDVSGIAMLPPQHPLAGRQSVRLEELADMTLLTYPRDAVGTVDRDIRLEFERNGFVPKQTLALHNTESLIARISAGLGWSIHRRSLRGKIPGVATVPIENFGFPVPVTLIHRAKESQPHILEVARRIRDVAAAEYPQMSRFRAYQHPPEPVPTKSHGNGRVELRDLRYFAAVVEERGIGRAAIRLGLTQPALSRQIRSMEQEIGVSLVARATRGIIPTVAGKSLYSAAREILGEASRLPAEVERGQRAAAGRCVIASLPSGIVRELLSVVMRTAGERYPHLELSVHSVPTPQQPEALNEGQYDIGLCHPLFNLTAGFPELEYRELLTDTLDCVLLPKHHPLAMRASLSFDDLAGIPFLFFRRDFHPAFFDYLMDAFHRAGYSPRLGPTQNGLHTLWSMVESEAGWALGFGSHRDDPPPGLASVPLEGFSLPWGVNLISRKNETRPAARAIIDLLFEESALRNVAVATKAEEVTTMSAFAGASTG